jgi:hypothetical protein
MYNSRALTTASFVFHCSLMCFSGCDACVYTTKQVPLHVCLLNITVQASVTGIVMLTTTANDNPSITGTWNNAWLIAKVAVMVVRLFGRVRHAGKTVEPAPWDDPIDLSDTEQPDWTCAICLESQPRRVVKFHNCMHMMHPECARQILPCHSSCPECKLPII